MRKQDKETSSNKQRAHQHRPLFIVALGAIFLLGGAFVTFQGLNDASGTQVNMLLLGQASLARTAMFSSQVRSDQAVAPEAPELVLLDKTSIRAITPPQTLGARALGTLIGSTSLEGRSSREIFDYQVKEGDTITALAERFEISTDTIVWANDLSASSRLTPGKTLIMLPTSGALHLVRPSDTLSEIALWYKGSMDDILAFNDIESAQDIFVGDLLIIPGGRKPDVLPNGRLTRLADSYFIMPVPRSFRITQGLHPFNAVDLGDGACGGPAYAAAGGIVQQTGYHGVAGNFVRILHANGVVTFYGHLSGQTVSPGARVLQGEIVGYIGHSGRTFPAGVAGCHLHFEVRGATNPFAR